MKLDPQTGIDRGPEREQAGGSHAIDFGNRRKSDRTRPSVLSICVAAGLAVLGVWACSGSESENWAHESSSRGGLKPPNSGDEQTACLVLDIDLDGFNDFVVTERTRTPSVVWYRRTPVGWDRHVIDDTVLPIEAGGASTDIDGDGDPDILFGGDWNSSDVWWWENPYPDFDTTTPWTRRLIKDSGAGQHHDQAFGDFDDDGDMELAFWNQRAGGKLYIAEIPPDPRAAGLWPRTEIFDGNDRSEGVVAVDVDLDGKTDIVGGGYWFRHEGGDEYSAHPIAPNQAPARTAVGQIIPGGRPEAVFSPGDADGPVTWHEWEEESREWQSHTLLDWVIHGHSVAAEDIDGDGYTDIFLAEMGDPGAGAKCRMMIFHGDGTGSFVEEDVAVGVANHESKVADLDGDGDLDILSKPYHMGSPRIDIWLQEGTNRLALDRWRRHVIDAEKPWRSVFIEPGDIDGDGFEDIVTGGWWYRNPDGAVGDWVRSAIGDPLRNMAAVHDFDGDGDLDILGTEGMGSDANSNFSWAENDGAGGFAIHDNIESATGDFLQGAIVGRFVPGDDLEVVLSWHDGGGGLQALTVSGGPVSETWPCRLLTGVTQKEEVSAGDIDRDGDQDLLLGTVWLRNEGGNWTALTLHETVMEPDRNRLADVNRDGRLDAVIGYETGSGLGTLAWYEQPTDPTTHWPEHAIAGIVRPMSLDAADMDGDGDVDVAAGEHNLNDPASARLFVYENLDGVGGDWKEHLVYTGDEHHDGARLADMDGDGDLDILSIGWSHGRVLLYENLAAPATTEVSASSVTIY